MNITAVSLREFQELRKQILAKPKVSVGEWEAVREHLIAALERFGKHREGLFDDSADFVFGGDCYEERSFGGLFLRWSFVTQSMFTELYALLSQLKENWIVILQSDIQGSDPREDIQFLVSRLGVHAYSYMFSPAEVLQRIEANSDLRFSRPPT